MFERFTESARSIVFRARENALADCEASIRPHHLLLALIDLHPEVFEGILNSPEDLRTIRHDLEPPPNSLGPARDPSQLRLNEQSRRVLRDATDEARDCWRQTARQRRQTGQAEARELPADLRYRQTRTGQLFSVANLPRGLVRWLLRRRWEVDERHILLGLLREVDCPAVRLLTKRGVTIEESRQRFCGTGT